MFCCLRTPESRGRDLTATSGRTPLPLPLPPYPALTADSMCFVLHILS